jgi:pimeloyl-ACP methyl ester carboxylesterase
MTDAKLPGLEERFAEIKGVRMRYFLGGEGPPLILVHGLGGAAANWTELVPLLIRRHRLLVPDLPGHGGSTALQPANRAPAVTPSPGPIVLGRPSGPIIVPWPSTTRPSSGARSPASSRSPTGWL